MKLNAYSVYDRKALQYHPPFFASTDGAAVRMLQDLVSDPASSISRHAGDYVLFRCGQYDDSNGSLAPCAPLDHVCDALSLLPKSKFSPSDEIALNQVA
ncbi:MAG: nonstructural protein [Microvirus sp.]|nr:MAG: nonstructural protein [Microvirus sp.]